MAHGAYNYRSGVDTYTNGDRRAVIFLQLLVDFGKGCDDLAPSTNRSFCVVVVCQRIAKVDEDPVTEVLGDISFVTSDDTPGRIVVGTHDVSQDLRVYLFRQFCRPHNVTKHDGELSSFSP